MCLYSAKSMQLQIIIMNANNPQNNGSKQLKRIILIENYVTGNSTNKII